MKTTFQTSKDLITEINGPGGDRGTSRNVCKRKLNQHWSEITWTVLILSLVNQRSGQPLQVAFTPLTVRGYSVNASIVYLSSMSYLY